MLSVVVPTLDAAGDLPAMVAGLASGGAMVGEIVVCDGGSSDPSVAVAEAHGARVVAAAPGRGGQLMAGAAAAGGDWLLFLHADTRLAAGWAREAARFMAEPGNQRRAAVFRFALDDDCSAARRLEAFVAWRCRALGLAYGDQGLLISRAFYDALGGFRPLPLMEDVDMARRIGRRRLVFLDSAAVTSARRYRRAGYFRRTARNATCVGLFFLGLPPRAIRRLYG